MTEELEKALKQEMGYTNVPRPTCKECDYGTLTADTMVDRSWHVNCNFNSIGTIIVNENGWCRFHHVKAIDINLRALEIKI